MRPEDSAFQLFSKIQIKFSEGLEQFVHHRFRPFLEHILRWRYAALTSFIALFIISVAIIAGGWAKISFFSEIEGDLAIANISFAHSTPASVTQSAVKRVEQAAKRVGEELFQETGERQVYNIFSSVGKAATTEDKSSLSWDLLKPVASPVKPSPYSGETKLAPFPTSVILKSTIP